MHPRRKDSGDSIYSLIKKKRLNYQILEKFPKIKQASDYCFKKIKTDDWIDKQEKIIISHFRSASATRLRKTHGEEGPHLKEKFIVTGENFNFSEKSILKEINLGAGKKVIQGFINVDIKPLEGIDVVWDLNNFPYPFPDNYASYVLLDNTLEHLDDPIRVLKELYRIGSNGCVIEIFVPYVKSIGAFQDLTHKHFFTEKTFTYFSSFHKLNYEVALKFEIIKNELMARKTGVNKTTILMRIIPFKKYFNVLFWDLYDTVHVILKIKK